MLVPGLLAGALLAAVLFAVDGVMLEALPVRFSVDAPILERARFVLEPLRSLRPLTGKLAIDTDLLNFPAGAEGWRDRPRRAGGGMSGTESSESVEPTEDALSLVFFSGDPGSSPLLACLFMAEPGVRRRVGCGNLRRLEGVGSFDILPLLKNQSKFTFFCSKSSKNKKQTQIP